MMKTQAIIVSAGLGTRLESEQPKLFIEINQKPILIHTLEVFDRCPSIESIIVVCHSSYVDQVKDLVKANPFKKDFTFVIGGETRSESVSNGLKALNPKTEVVAIHDGARPLVTEEIVKEAVRQGSIDGAVTTAVPVKPTIKEVDQATLKVQKTLDRKKLWEIQTPQVFKREIIVKAHETNTANNPTDDAALVEALGVDVKVVQGDYKNIKITTREDLILAEAFMNQSIKQR